MALDKVVQRLEELIARGELIAKDTIRIRSTTVYVVTDTEAARQWHVSSLTVLGQTFGQDSAYFRQANYDHKDSQRLDCVISIQAALRAALDDIKGGYIFQVRALLESEVCGDFLEQAEELLKANYKDPAAVLAGAVLERHLRSMCDSRGIALVNPKGKPKAMNDLADDLARAGAFNTMKKKQITAWAAIRNHAAHGQSNEYQAGDVKSLIRDVNDFCANFS